MIRRMPRWLTEACIVHSPTHWGEELPGLIKHATIPAWIIISMQQVTQEHGLDAEAAADVPAVRPQDLDRVSAFLQRSINRERGRGWPASCHGGSPQTPMFSNGSSIGNCIGPKYCTHCWSAFGQVPSGNSQNGVQQPSGPSLPFPAPVTDPDPLPLVMNSVVVSVPLSRFSLLQARGRAPKNTAMTRMVATFMVGLISLG